MQLVTNGRLDGAQSLPSMGRNPGCRGDSRTACPSGQACGGVGADVSGRRSGLRDLYCFRPSGPLVLVPPCGCPKPAQSLSARRKATKGSPASHLLWGAQETRRGGGHPALARAFRAPLYMSITPSPHTDRWSWGWEEEEKETGCNTSTHLHAPELLWNQMTPGGNMVTWHS